MPNPNPTEAKKVYVDKQHGLRKKPREELLADIEEPIEAGPFDKAEFDCTMSGFQQNARGDYRVLLSVPFRCRETVLELSNAHGNLLHITVEKWRREHG